MKERNGRRREVSGRLPLIDNKEGISPRDCERGCNTATGSCLSVDRYYSNFAEKDEEEEEESGPASHGPSYDRPTCDTTGINV